MGLILSEQPIQKVVEIPKVLAKTSVEDAKIHPKRPYRQKKKNIGRFFAEKNVFLRKSCVFACLG
jgi:hypothetical protein